MTLYVVGSYICYIRSVLGSVRAVFHHTLNTSRTHTHTIQEHLEVIELCYHPSKKSGERTFQVSAIRLWNNVKLSLKNIKPRIGAF